VNEPVLIVRPDDGSIGPKHVALYVLLMVIIDVLDENINTLGKPEAATGVVVAPDDGHEDAQNMLSCI
jgi:hypothetical protein